MNKSTQSSVHHGSFANSKEEFHNEDYEYENIFNSYKRFISPTDVLASPSYFASCECVYVCIVMYVSIHSCGC